MRDNSWLKNRRFWLGFALSAVLLALFFWQVPIRHAVDALRGANYFWFIPAIAVYFVAVFFRTYRWHFLLRPLKLIPWPRLYPVVVVGYMANNLIPLRLGEVVRSFYAAQREGISGSAALATIIVERVFDGIVLILIAVCVWPFLPVGHLLRDFATRLHLALPILLFLVLAPFVTVFLVVLSTAAYPGRAKKVVTAIIGLAPQRFAKPVIGLALQFVDGLEALRSPRRTAAMLLLSLPIWICEAVMYYFIGIGFGLQQPFHGMMLVTATSNLATSIPSPGGVGPFELGTQVTLEALGAPVAQITGYAIALHAALIAPVTMLGIYYVWSWNESLSKVFQRSTGKSLDPGPVKS